MFLTRDISCLITYSGGFICSYGVNTVYVVEQIPHPQGGEEILFKGSKKIVFPKRVIQKDNLLTGGYSVRSLSISPGEDLLIALTDDLLLYSYQLKKKEGSQAKKNVFTIFLYPFHSAGLRGLDICHRKPLVVTGSDDQTIRVWNYRSFGMELAKKFREEIHSVAIHPDGLYVAVGFIDKIRFLNLLIDDMRLFQEFPVRESRVCLFSHGGHLLVAAVKDVIHVYNTISFKLVHLLKGHEGEVSSLCWSSDDLKLVSCADNGSVYEWNMASGARTHEVVVKTCSFSYLSLSPDTETVYAVGSDKTVKQIRKSRIEQEIDLHSFQLSSVCLSGDGKVLVSGSSTGATQLFDFPLALPGKWKEWRMHGDTVNFMKITHTNDTLVTGSRDGSFCIWDIWSDALKQEPEKYNFAEEILITKTELEEKNILIDELKQKVDESKTECAYQLRLKDNQNAEALKEMSKKSQIEKQQTKSEMNKLSLEIDSMKKNRLLELDAIDKKNVKEMQEQSDTYKAKLVVEYDKYDKLMAEYNKIKEASVRRVEDLEKSIEKKVEKIKEEFNNKLSSYEDEVKSREKSNDEKIRSIEEILKQTEEDADKEILEIKTKYEKELKLERETLIKVRGELGISKKKNLSCQKDLDSQKENIEWMGKEQQKMKGDIKMNEKDKLDLKKEIKTRDNSILEKEKEIVVLKRELRHMENTKFVFQHKISALQDEIKPKDDKIDLLKQQILDMEAELTNNVKDLSDNEAHTEEVKGKLVTALADLSNERRKVTVSHSNMIKVVKDIEDMQAKLQDSKKLKVAALNLCNKYLNTPGMDSLGEEEDTMDTETVRQKEYLERVVTSQKHQLRQMEKLHKLTYSKMLQDNKHLLAEIALLKKEMTEMRRYKI